MTKFSSNPLLFKVQYINRDRFDTTMGISGVIGQAFHNAMEVYYGGSDTLIVTSEAEAIEYGLKTGMDFLEKYNDGYITFSDRIPNKQKAQELLAYAFENYVTERPYDKEKVVGIEEEILEQIDVTWRGQQLKLPVKLKGYLDKVIREDGKIKVIDYKTCSTYSNPEKIDGAKILQAITYYLLAYAKYGEEPHSLTFQEVKYTKNQDGGKQVREYEIVFAENELYFDFFFRFYEDMTRALNGEQVYVPNVHALFDNEVAIIAYIHRLDVEEEKAALMKKHKVENITELLKKEMQSAGNMRKLMKTVEANFVSAKNLNYDKMNNEEKIKIKLMEHGMMLQFDSVVHGASVDLYRYTPSIGLKMSRLKNYTEDVEQVLGVARVRILAPIANSTMVGFEVPRVERTFPSVPAMQGFEIAVGQDIMGADRRFDIRTAPHVLVAGASGKGKSVWLNSTIKQLASIPNADLFLYDPKRVELKQFKGIAADYQSGMVEIYTALFELEASMQNRYKKLEEAGVRSIEGMPDMRYAFIVIDEFGQLISANYTHTETKKTGRVYTKGQMKGEEEVEITTINVSSEIERLILSIAQMGRAAGMHLIIATQSPRVDVIKGTIKANFPTKVLFQTAKANDSLVVIDELGGEKLNGKGDMLFAGDNGIERLQGYLS